MIVALVIFVSGSHGAAANAQHYQPDRHAADTRLYVLVAIAAIALVVRTAVLLPWVIGVGLKNSREHRQQAKTQEARHRADEERLQIAREVHDVVAHGLAVINMQAGVALHVLERRPEQSRVALEAIKGASKA